MLDNIDIWTLESFLSLFSLRKINMYIPEVKWISITVLSWLKKKKKKKKKKARL